MFTPLAFLTGSTGRLFNEFGIAVAGSVIISGFVALTLTPMLCAKILRVPPAPRRAVPRARDRVHRGWPPATPAPCGGALRHRLAVVVGALAGHRGARSVVFRSLKREFVPPEDKGWFFNFVIAPEGSSLAYTDGYQRQAEAILAQDQRRRELLQRGEPGRRREPRHDLHQPRRLVQAEAVGAGHHRRGAAPVLRHPGRVRVRQQPAGLRVREPGQLRHPAPGLRLAGPRQRHAAGAGAPDRRPA